VTAADGALYSRGLKTVIRLLEWPWLLVLSGVSQPPFLLPKKASRGSDANNF